MLKLVADFPAMAVFSNENANLQMTEDKGYVRTCPITLVLKAFPKDKYEYIRNYTVGIDTETQELFVFGNGAMISDSPSAKDIGFAVELGGTVRIEDKVYEVQEAPNHNLKLVAV